MELDYLNINIDKLYNDLISNNISLNVMAKNYGFPSPQVLMDVIKKYCKKQKLQVPDQIIKFDSIPTLEENQIYDDYMEKGISIRELIEIHNSSEHKIKKAIEKVRNDRKEWDRKKAKRQKVYDAKKVEAALDALINKKQPYEFVQNKYRIPINYLKQLLAQTPEGQKILEEKARPPQKVEISKEEALRAYLENDYEKYSYSLIRERLIEYFGKNYASEIDKKGNKKKEEELEDILRLYLDGVSLEKIAEIKQCDKNVIDTKIKKYYQKSRKKRPKILEKEDFENYMKKQSSIEIEKIIAFYENKGYHIPEPVIEEYFARKGEVDLRKVKKIVHQELAKLIKQEKKANLIAPFEFANKLKEKGYGTKYRACAMLYSLIKDNNLSTDILKSLHNEEITTAINILLNPKKQNELKQNELAHTIYSIQIESTNSDDKELR